MSERGNLRKLCMRVTAVLMTIIVTCLTYASAVLFSLCVPGKVIDIVNNSDYYHAQAQCIEERLADITKAAGLNESIYAGIFESKEISDITREYTANRINGYDDELNKEAVRERMKANILALMEAEDKSKSAIDSAAMNHYLEQAASVYEQTVDNALVKNYGNVRSALSKAMIVGLVAMLIALAACICFIYALTKMRRKTLSYMIRALEASVLLTAVPAFLGYVCNWGKYIAYSPAYMADVTIRYVNELTIYCLLIASIWIVFIGILGIAVYRLKRKKRK